MSRGIPINEQTIEQAAEQLAENADFEVAIEQLQQDQPIVMGWFFSANFDLFTQAEREYLLYLTLVIYHSIRLAVTKVPQPDADAISQAEERNWETMSTVNSSIFHQRLDPFFKTTDQEDLLAFIEDALSDYEDDELVTREGREALFIVLKTLVDCWTDNDGVPISTPPLEPN